MVKRLMRRQGAEQLKCTRLYLVRHGETDWNLAGRIQGHRPTSLNETGRTQAALLGRFFAPLHLSAVWSSDLPRAAETAAAIAVACGLPVKTTAALRERNLQYFEGLAGSEIDAALQEAARINGRDYRSWHEVPGVETDQEMLDRLLPVLQEAGEAEGGVAVITHAGVQKLLLRRILDLPSGRLRAALVNGLVIALAPDGEGWSLTGLYAPDILERLLGR